MAALQLMEHKPHRVPAPRQRSRTGRPGAAPSESGQKIRPRAWLDLEHPTRYSSSLNDGLAMLRCFSPEHLIRGIADMADDLGLGRSTTHRYATTLVALGYLEQSRSRKYQLSPRALDVSLSLLESMPIRLIAHEQLQHLRNQTRHSTTLWVLAETEIVCIDRWHGSGQGQYAIDVGIGPGTRLPAHCTAAGKAILARLPAAEQNALIAKLKLRRHGPRTITTKTGLRAELEHIAHDDGLAVEDEELRAGRRALGAAVVVDGDWSPIAALEAAVPAAGRSRRELVRELGPVVSDCAGRIGVALARIDSQSEQKPAVSSKEVQ